MNLLIHRSASTNQEPGILWRDSGLRSYHNWLCLLDISGVPWPTDSTTYSGNLRHRDLSMMNFAGDIEHLCCSCSRWSSCSLLNLPLGDASSSLCGYSGLSMGLMMVTIRSSLSYLGNP